MDVRLENLVLDERLHIECLADYIGILLLSPRRLSDHSIPVIINRPSSDGTRV